MSQGSAYLPVVQGWGRDSCHEKWLASLDCGGKPRGKANKARNRALLNAQQQPLRQHAPSLMFSWS